MRVGGWNDGVAETLALVAHQQMSTVVYCFLRERDRAVERGGAQGLHCLQFRSLSGLKLEVVKAYWQPASFPGSLLKSGRRREPGNICRKS